MIDKITYLLSALLQLSVHHHDDDDDDHGGKIGMCYVMFMTI